MTLAIRVPRTMQQVDDQMRGSCAIRARALVNIELHLGAVAELRRIYAREGDHLDELLDEKSALCPDTAAALLKPVPPLSTAE